MKVGVWYEVRNKIGNKFKVIVMRVSDDVIKKPYIDNSGYYICYKIQVYGSINDPCDIVAENWNFRELTPVEQELL